MNAVVRPSVTLIYSIVERLEFLGRSWSLDLFSNEVYKRKWASDLAVMHDNDALHAVRLELLDAQGRTVFCYRQKPGALGGAEQGSLPVIALEAVKSHRVMVEFNNVDLETLRGYLQLSWRDGEQSKPVEGRVIAAQTGSSYFVGDSQRHLLVITATGTRGYSFAETDGAPRIQGVFFHHRWLADCQQPVFKGARFSGVLVSTAEGVQARDLRAA
jgi:hypothetical protein